MQLLFWIIDGLAAGWLTGTIMSGPSRDLWMDTLTGMAGGVAGGFIVNSSGYFVQGNPIYANLAAVLVAVILTVLTRSVGARREHPLTD